MTGNSVQKRTGYLAIGGFGIFLSAAYLGMAADLPFGEVAQPGAAVFPIISGVLLLIGSLAALWEGWKMAPGERADIPAGKDRKRLLALIGLLLAYFVCLPWLGQLVVSTLFCWALMRLLSNQLSWLRSAVYSAIIGFTLYAVFVHLLKVPMPRGALFV
jgi:putative tricarboxylic transport membrane protein